MPHSLIINLIPRSPISPNYSTGKHLHALFLNLVSSVDRDLGDYLHEQKTDKAFTISPLQVTGNRLQGTGNRKHSILQYQQTKPIPAGTPCWWRVSLLDDRTFANLSKLWLNLNPSQPWHLGAADLEITSVLGTPQSNQPWANFLPYDRLYEQASDRDREITFNFSTPTVFRQGKYDSALPTRECVFNSLLSRWNRYSNIPFSDLNLDCLFPSFFDIHTELMINPDGKCAGCVGAIGYRILGNIDLQKIKQINTLADFALYAGIGRKTTMGMGMVRRAGNK
jgi:CRISPR-associated endoribonuclease Cas6